MFKDLNILITKLSGIFFIYFSFVRFLFTYVFIF